LKKIGKRAESWGLESNEDLEANFYITVQAAPTNLMEVVWRKKRIYRFGIDSFAAAYFPPDHRSNA